MRRDSARISSTADSCSIRNSNRLSLTDSNADSHVHACSYTDADPASTGNFSHARGRIPRQ